MFNVVHTVERPEVLRPDVRMIYYSSVKMSDVQTTKWFTWVKNNFPNIEPRKPWITIAYSTKHINAWPFERMTCDEEFTAPTHVEIAPNDILKFDIFTDPRGINHLVLLLNSPGLKKTHDQFIEYGGSWDFEDYQPHITLESNTSYTKETIQNLPLPHFHLLFEVMQFSIFGEVI